LGLGFGQNTTICVSSCSDDVDLVRKKTRNKKEEKDRRNGEKMSLRSLMVTDVTTHVCVCV